ncbi:collagen alpha-1(XVII) chain-like [Phaenicophaeus curvirostris]|uniref:collagen alpha-1(XVII) chain-like n=1 Tax=Phaenicophaeus curvirostris TaxID=33595 RepID=UPI0037F0F530
MYLLDSGEPPAASAPSAAAGMQRGAPPRKTVYRISVTMVKKELLGPRRGGRGPGSASLTRAGLLLLEEEDEDEEEGEEERERVPSPGGLRGCRALSTGQLELGRLKVPRTAGTPESRRARGGRPEPGDGDRRPGAGEPGLSSGLQPEEAGPSSGLQRGDPGKLGLSSGLQPGEPELSSGVQREELGLSSGLQRGESGLELSSGLQPEEPRLQRGDLGLQAGEPGPSSGLQRGDPGHSRGWRQQQQQREEPGRTSGLPRGEQDQSPGEQPGRWGRSPGEPLRRSFSFRHRGEGCRSRVRRHSSSGCLPLASPPPPPPPPPPPERPPEKRNTLDVGEVLGDPLSRLERWERSKSKNRTLDNSDLQRLSERLGREGPSATGTHEHRLLRFFSGIFARKDGPAALFGSPHGRSPRGSFSRSRAYFSSLRRAATDTQSSSESINGSPHKGRVLGLLGQASVAQWLQERVPLVAQTQKLFV